MLANLKLLLGVTGNDKDGLLQFVLDSVINQVRTHCNMDELEPIPPGLETIIVRMAVDLWRLEGYGQEATAKEVSSVKRGDVTTTFQAVGGNYNAMTGAGGAEFIKAYTRQLNAYRKLRW